MIMMNISIILPMHFEVMAIYEVPAGNRYARVALMESTFSVLSAKRSHVHSYTAQKKISSLFSRRTIILKS